MLLWRIINLQIGASADLIPIILWDELYCMAGDTNNHHINICLEKTSGTLDIVNSVYLYEDIFINMFPKCCQ